MFFFSLSSIRSCVATLLTMVDHIDILLNNAGVCMLPYSITEVIFLLFTNSMMEAKTLHRRNFDFENQILAYKQGKLVTTKNYQKSIKFCSITINKLKS